MISCHVHCIAIDAVAPSCCHSKIVCRNIIVRHPQPNPTNNKLLSISNVTLPLLFTIFFTATLLSTPMSLAVLSSWFYLYMIHSQSCNENSTERRVVSCRSMVRKWNIYIGTPDRFLAKSTSALLNQPKYTQWYHRKQEKCIVVVDYEQHGLQSKNWVKLLCVLSRRVFNHLLTMSGTHVLLLHGCNVLHLHGSLRKSY